MCGIQVITSSGVNKNIDLNTPVYSEQELALLNKNNIPTHIAIIPDGNRRWALQIHAGSEAGYQEGSNTLTEIVRAASQIGIKFLTIYCFSTENWKRPASEIKFLMSLFEKYLKDYQKELINGGVRLETIGEITRCPASLIQTIDETKMLTKDCSKIHLILAFNYGGRDEICRAVSRMLDDFEAGKLSKSDISEGTIAKYLDTGSYPDPDLIIRTSGEQRMSNFLLWQGSYSEVYIDHVYWPSFTPRHFLCAMIDYQKRHRRKGGP